MDEPRMPGPPGQEPVGVPGCCRLWPWRAKRGTRALHPSRTHAPHSLPSPLPVPRVQVIAGAKVPIIKFEEMESGYKFDISFNKSNGPAASPWLFLGGGELWAGAGGIVEGLAGVGEREES